MNQNQIHPALRQSALSSPAKPQTTHYPDAATSTYSPIQPSPSGSYQSIHTPNYYPAAQQVQESPEGDSPGGNPADPNDLKRPRACEACRQLKVKCEPDDNNPTGSCKRCAKAHRQCVVTVPSRKRQKKTDSRVAELEKKIDALTASLAARTGGPIGGGGGDLNNTLDPAIAHHQQQQQQHQHQHQHQQQYSQSQPQLHSDQWQRSPSQQQNNSYTASPPVRQSGRKRKPSEGPDYYRDEPVKPTQSQLKPSPPVPQFHAAYGEQQQKSEPADMLYVDVIDRNIIDAHTAYRCYDRYRSDMCILFPVVVLPYGQTAAELRRSSPLLFLAIVAVGSNTIIPHLQSKLTSEVLRTLGDRIITNGEKSLEIVQTIQLMTIFYQPPERYEELNFNQLVHIAAVMAMDLGMGKRTKKGLFTSNKGRLDPNSIEARRCWLGCYYMCTNSAMSLRRPLLVRWSPYTEESVQVLTTSKEALPSDKMLCHLARAQHIGENIQIEFSMDDPAQTLSLTDSQTQRHLKVFEQNLGEWHESGGDMLNQPIMKHTEAIINLYMHEIAMHRDHNIDDFRPPFNNPLIEGPPNPDLVTPAHIRSLTACLHSAHNAFEAFLAMDINALRAVPTHFFVRNSYAAVALIKLYSAVTAKGSKFGSILEKEELKVESYLDRLIETLQKVAEGGMSKVARKFTLIFGTLRKWHLKRFETPVVNGTYQPGSAKSESADFKILPPIRDTSQAWSQPSQTTAEQDSQPQPPRSGLQVLSDAAMAPGRPDVNVNTNVNPSSQNQWTAANAQPAPQMNSNSNQIPPPPMPTGLEGINISAQEYDMIMAAYGASNDPLAMGGFTSDDFMAFGLGNDLVNFGLNQDGTWVI